MYCFAEIEKIDVSGTSFEISSSISRRVSGTVEQAKKQLEKETAISYTEPLMLFRETLIKKLIMARNRLSRAFSGKKGKNMKTGTKVKTPIKYLFDAEIIEINGNLATIKGYQIWEKFGKKKKVETKRVFPLTALRENEYSEKIISEENRFGTRIRWNGTEIEKTVLNTEVLYMYQKYAEGRMNMSPSYQRGLVWTEKQKQEYLTALFKSRAEITPVFVQERFDGKEHYEVLDGKQRLNAIFEFIEDKIELEGTKFSELSAEDTMKLLNYDIRYTRILSYEGKIPEDFKLEYFLEINEKGTKMSENQIEKVKNMLKFSK